MMKTVLQGKEKEQDRQIKPKINEWHKWKQLLTTKQLMPSQFLSSNSVTIPYLAM